MSTSILPFFPLSVVVLPGEVCRLHIFEPRYKQLINDCVDSKTTFVIPFLNKSKFSDLGTEAIIKKVISTSENGEMDIEIIGARIFKILNYRNPLPNKLYSGGEIEYLDFFGGKIDKLTNELFVDYIKSITEDNEDDYYQEHLLNYNQIADNIIQSQEDKYKYISLNSAISIKTFLINYMKLSLEINKQEKMLESRFVFN